MSSFIHDIEFSYHYQLSDIQNTSIRQDGLSWVGRTKGNILSHYGLSVSPDN